MYDDYIKGDGMDPIGTTPDDLKLNSLGAFYTIPGIIPGICVKISKLIETQEKQVVANVQSYFSFEYLRIKLFPNEYNLS